MIRSAMSFRSPAAAELDSQPIDLDDPNNQGLYAYWPTVLGTGNKLREMVRGWDAVGYNGATVGASPVVGMAISNLTGDASARYYRAPFTWSGSSPITVSFWAYVESSWAVNGKCWFGDDVAWPGGGYP